MKYCDVAVIGGGPAGMAAALAARKQGAETVIIERDERLGGILNQCIHNGFGLHYFGEELTGPEYAYRFEKEIENSGIKVMLGSFVLELRKDKTLLVVSAEEGVLEIKPKAIVLAMGCRERSAGAIQLTGRRIDGIWTAGFAQRLCNIEGKMVGKNVVILGSGDIGLIMARRMTFEGANVIMVCEKMAYSGGLRRNIVQCLEDFDIPLLLSTTVTRVVGTKRVEGVYIADVVDGKTDFSTERFVKCDTLLLSVGLIPETDILEDCGIERDKRTGSVICDEFRHTSLDGVFACGNVLHVHDLVDKVSKEAEFAGEGAGKYATGAFERTERNISVMAGNGVKYALPQIINGETGRVTVFFRSDVFYRNAKITVTSGEDVIMCETEKILRPGEMQTVGFNKEDIKSNEIVISVEEMPEKK